MTLVGLSAHKNTQTEIDCNVTIQRHQTHSIKCYPKKTTKIVINKRKQEKKNQKLVN